MSTDFTIPAGLPFSRLIRVTDGKNIWSTIGACEVRCQLRKSASTSSNLIANLHDYMTKAYGTGDNANDIEITWSMTGAQTAAITSGGKYDLILSDTGATDARAIQVLRGSITFSRLVTTATGET